MAPVTIDAAARNSYYSAGNIGWSAKSAFVYRTVIQQLVAASLISLGDVTSRTKQSQSFTTVGAIDVSLVRVVGRKNNAPTDNFSLAIHADTGSNLPGTLIATADNAYNGASLTTVSTWLEFQFGTAVSLSATTKYWLVLSRSGAVDATNYFILASDSGSLYSGGGRSSYDGSVWGAESASVDVAFQVLTETPSAFYHVTQDTFLHVWKSTDDGATWGEQDAADAPTVTDATFPFDACDTRSGPYLTTARMTGANLVGVRVFDMALDQWDSADWGATAFPDEVSSERSIHIACDNTFITDDPGAMTIHITSSLDDADLTFHRSSTRAGSWGAAASSILALTSTEASLLSAIVIDKAPIGFVHRLYYDVTNDDFSMRSIITTTSGAETDLSAAAADVETEHASAVYQIYQNASFVDTIIAAFIDAGGTLQERILNLEVTSASVTMAADNAVDTATTTAGRQIWTGRFNDTNYIIVSVSGTGISYYTSTVAGTWSSATVHLSGLTASSLSQALAIDGYGLGLFYTDNGDAKFDWIVAPSGGVTESSRIIQQAVAIQVIDLTRTIPQTVAISIVDQARTIPQNVAVKTVDHARTIPQAIAIRTELTRIILQSVSVNVSNLTRAVPQSIAVKVNDQQLVTPQSIAIAVTDQPRTIPQSISILEAQNRVVPQAIAIAVSDLTRTISQTVAIKTERTRDVPQAVAILVSDLTRTIQQAVAVLIEATRTIPQSVAILTTGERTIPQLIAIVTSNERIIPQTIAIEVINVEFREIPQAVHISVADIERTVPQSVAVLTEQSRTIPQTIAIQTTGERVIPQGVAVAVLDNTRVIPQSVAIAVIDQTRDVSQSIAILTTGEQAIPQAIAVSTTNERVIPQAVAISVIGTQFSEIPQSIHVSVSNMECTVPQAVHVLTEQSRTILQSIAIQVELSRTILQAAHIRLTVERAIPQSIAIRITEIRVVPQAISIYDVIGIELTILQAVAIQVATSREVPQTFAISVSDLTRTIQQDVAISIMDQSRTIPQVVAIKTVGHVRTIPQAIALSTELSRTVAQDIAISVADLSRTVPQRVAIKSLALTITIPQTMHVKTLGHQQIIPQSVAVLTSFECVIPQFIVIDIEGTTDLTIPQRIAIFLYTLGPLTGVLSVEPAISGVLDIEPVLDGDLDVVPALTGALSVSH